MKSFFLTSHTYDTLDKEKRMKTISKTMSCHLPRNIQMISDRMKKCGGRLKSDELEGCKPKQSKTLNKTGDTNGNIARDGLDTRAQNDE